MTALLQVANLKKYFPAPRGWQFWRSAGELKAVDDVSFDIEQGTTFGLVGESGSGKTTVSRLLLMLQTPTAGSVRFADSDLNDFRRSPSEYRRVVQAVFQDPYSSLNPRMTVGDLLAEPMIVHRVADSAAASRRVDELLDLVGLSTRSRNLYPHQFSGGQRQRVAIARALSVGPKFIIFDEPVSALDVSIRAQILNLLVEIQQRLQLTYLMIAHDLAVVEHVSDTCGVMYLGRLVEICPSRELSRNPLHPYTQALIAAVPVPDPDFPEPVIVVGETPSPLNPPSGCRFHTRCPRAVAQCRSLEPVLREVAPNHWAACHLVQPTELVS